MSTHETQEQTDLERESQRGNGFYLGPALNRPQGAGDWSQAFPRQLEPGDAMPDPTKPFDPAENYDVDLSSSIRALVRGEKVTIVSTDELAPFYAIEKAKAYHQQRLEALENAHLEVPPESLGQGRFFSLQPALGQVDTRYRRERERKQRERFPEEQASR